MKKVRRQIAVLLGIVLCAAVSAGCSGNAYHAELALLKRSVDLNGYIREDFLEENRVFGAFYPIGEAEDGTADYEQLTDESYPRERIFCIRSEEEFNGVFVLPPQELKADFQTQMLVVYTQACMYSRRSGRRVYARADLSVRCYGCVGCNVDRLRVENRIKANTTEAAWGKERKEKILRPGAG